MTALSDLETNDEARVIAESAGEWLERNRTLGAIDKGSEPFVCIDNINESPDRVFYLPADMQSCPENLRFGHIMMRPGFTPFGKAAVTPYGFERRLVCVICPISAFTADPEAILAPDVFEASFVHEAAHVLDFRRFGQLPRPYHTSDRDNLRKLYYNLPHEFNAFFHQGLY